MSKNKKRFSRRNRGEESKKHIFSHEAVKPITRSAVPKKEGSEQIVEDSFTYIKKDLRLFLIVAGAILLITIVLYVMTRSVNFKIFNVNV
ncbi:hypothetical protein COY62_02900 [bacterium (Candidatus Howlettbacteria) CG_4_10_14_0_8_um_filter_40_9]|nr:MAG: hypothetical protein COY62_02900 [bacterium (Candidatus Howlettbacteria) CG_4_10_14_0_8_um_filter_40_9]